MTGQTRRNALLVAFGLAVCLVSSKPPQIVGDGGEYLVYALNFVSLHGPSLRTRDLDELKQEVRDYAPELEDETFYRNAIPGRDARRDFMHFWFMSLAAAPFVALAKAIGLPAIYGFVWFNLTLFLGALWVALPRIGVASSVLLFGSPIVWWLNKAHPEIFMFSLLVVAVLWARDRPWWAMVAAGVASTQYPHLGAMIVLVAGMAVLFDRTRLRDRRLILGLAAGLGIAMLHPAYYYVRHGTPSLLLSVSNTGTPTLAEFSAVLLDPVIGLLPNFPVFLFVVVAALALVLRRHARVLLAADVLVVLAIGALFIWVFGQKDNVHHGATPSLSRYALWFIPLALPLLLVERIDGAEWRRFMWSSAIVSSLICIFAFHPSVPQNSREPTWPAEYLWTKHPGWQNPLPEVFTETYRKTEDPLAPTQTYGCEKILLGGAGAVGTWPIPCFPADTPMPCAGRNIWCYANLDGASYEFIRAPGRWNRLPVVEDDATWPRQAEPTVRRVYQEWRWWEMRQDVRKVTFLDSATDVRLQAVEGSDRFILVLRDPGSKAALTFKLPTAMTGMLIDPRTGQTLQALSGPAGQTWEVPIPSAPNLMLLALRR